MLIYYVMIKRNLAANNFGSINDGEFPDIFKNNQGLTMPKLLNL